jgi:hypothetical protein
LHILSFLKSVLKIQSFLTKCLYFSIYLISILAVRLLFVFRDVLIYVICLSFSLSFSPSLCPSVSLLFYVTVFLLCFQLYLYVLSFCSVFLFCLSVLSFCSAFLFCLSVLNFCSVFLFCLSVLSFCSVFLFCFLVQSSLFCLSVYLYFKKVFMFIVLLSFCSVFNAYFSFHLFLCSLWHAGKHRPPNYDIDTSAPMWSAPTIFFLLMIGATKIVTNMGTFTSFR